jgi:hypothetical protein
LARGVADFAAFRVSGGEGVMLPFLPHFRFSRSMVADLAAFQRCAHFAVSAEISGIVMARCSCLG